MARTTLALLASVALLAAACGGDRPSEDVAADSVATSGDATAAAPASSPPPAEDASPAAAAPRPGPTEQVPTAADSAAALAEDVSPEWKMRARQMEPFASCMEKTVNAPPDLRPTLVEACHRLPDAPKPR